MGIAAGGLQFGVLVKIGIPILWVTSFEAVNVPIRKLILGVGISSKKCQGQPRLLEALLL